LNQTSQLFLLVVLLFCLFDYVSSTISDRLPQGETSPNKRIKSDHQKKELICLKLSLVAPATKNSSSRKSSMFGPIYTHILATLPGPGRIADNFLENVGPTVRFSI